jgi:hypothetical protein
MMQLYFSYHMFVYDSQSDKSNEENVGNGVEGDDEGSAEGDCDWQSTIL